MPSSTPKPEDLKITGFPSLTWNGQNDVTSLETLRTHVVNQANEASNWYLRNRYWKRFFGIKIRFTAWILTTVAGIIPILAQIFTHDGKPDFAPAWASVALALAAGLIGLDYVFGYSSSWIRYMETQQRIMRVLREFLFDWEALRAGWDGNPPAAQVLAALDRLKRFGLQVQQHVEDETNAWITEFRNSMRMVDEAARAKTEAADRSGMNVIVTNHAQSAGDWALSIDDGAPTNQLGSRAALVGLTPGSHKFRAEGTIDGNRKRDEVTAVVPATGVGEVSLTLR